MRFNVQRPRLPRWRMSMLEKRLLKPTPVSVRRSCPHLSIKLCLTDSCRSLETGLRHGIELVKHGRDILAHGFPSPLLPGKKPRGRVRALGSLPSGSNQHCCGASFPVERLSLLLLWLPAEVGERFRGCCITRAE